MHAICSQVGCIKVDQSPDFDLGVTLKTPGASVKTVQLLPGAYSPYTESPDEGEYLIQPFLYQKVDNIPVQGFQIDLTRNPALVTLINSTSLIAYGKPFFHGSNDASVASFILRSGYFAILNATNAAVKSVQVHDGIFDVGVWGMGQNASFTLDAVHPGSDITANGPYCPRNQFPSDKACQPCANRCASCYGPRENQCLSCGEQAQLAGGRCAPIVCLGGATTVPGIGTCLESLATYDVSSPSVIKSSLAVSKAAIIIPSLLGGSLFLLVLFCIYKSKKQARSKEHVNAWAARHFPSTILDPRIPPPLKIPLRTSGGTEGRGLASAMITPYSVPPESDGGPPANDDWEIRQVELARRKDHELARLRQEGKRGIYPITKRNWRAPLALAEETWEMGQLRHLADHFDDEASILSLSTSSQRLRSPPSGTPPAISPRVRRLPKQIDTKASMRHTSQDSSAPRTGMTRLHHWRSEMKNSKPDPIEPTRTIVTTQPVPETPGPAAQAVASTPLFSRIEEWARQPKEQPELAKTIVGGATTVYLPPDSASTSAPTFIKAHSRDAPKSSKGNRYPKSETSFLTSVSRAKPKPL